MLIPPRDLAFLLAAAAAFSACLPEAQRMVSELFRAPASPGARLPRPGDVERAWGRAIRSRRPRA